jgi:uncharacterized FlaG/YvyC family protein
MTVESTSSSRPLPAPETPRTARAIEAAKLAVQRARPAVSEEALTRAMEARLSVSVQNPTQAKLSLDVDKETGRVVGRVIDKDSGKVIQQIPTEEMLRLIAATKEMLGPLLDQTV